MGQVIRLDDKGLIFTTDATLALIIFMVFSASFVTYYVVPIFAGQDQQSLDAIAGDALRVMELDGTISLATSYYLQGEPAKGRELLKNRTDSLIPDNIGYELTIRTTPPLTVRDDRGLTLASDVTSRVEVISGPEEGWMGRAWYKVEEADFEPADIDVVATSWNYHNWLTNFEPWSLNGGSLRTYPLWGSTRTAPNNPIPITFSLPPDADIKGGRFIMGSCNRNRSGIGPPYSFQLNMNNLHTYNVPHGDFTFLYRRPPQATLNYPMYDVMGDISAQHLLPGRNSFYVRFTDPVANRVSGDSRGHDMPWFTLLTEYTTTIDRPTGIRKYDDLYDPFFPDAAGLASLDQLDDGSWGVIYNINTGAVSPLWDNRVIRWDDMLARDHAYDDGLPFVITDLPITTYNQGTAVSVVKDITAEEIPLGNRILDATVHINMAGGSDIGLVEVWNGDEWIVVFDPYESSQIADPPAWPPKGYGNIPSVIYIGDVLRPGEDNKVRITSWDFVNPQAGARDYDLAGVLSCYVDISYTGLPIDWRNFEFDNIQSANNIITDERPFTIEENAQRAYLFSGYGVDTSRIVVRYRDGRLLYDSDQNNYIIPYKLDLGQLDAERGYNHITEGGVSDFTLRPGDYNLRVTVYGPEHAWQSGDFNRNAEIYSGTRIAILYPEFLENIWTVEYAQEADHAMKIAKEKLIQHLQESGIYVSEDDIEAEALYTGDLPNVLPVRLDLWRQ